MMCKCSLVWVIYQATELFAKYQQTKLKLYIVICKASCWQTVTKILFKKLKKNMHSLMDAFFCMNYEVEYVSILKFC